MLRFPLLLLYYASVVSLFFGCWFFTFCLCYFFLLSVGDREEKSLLFPLLLVYWFIGCLLLLFWTQVARSWSLWHQLICPLAGVVTVSTLALMTYQGYTRDCLLYSTHSNNYDNWVHWLQCMCLYSNILLVVQWCYKYVVCRIRRNDSLSNKYHSVWHTLAGGAQWVGHSCMTSVHFGLIHTLDYGYSVFSPSSLGTLIILGYDTTEILY